MNCIICLDDEGSVVQKGCCCRGDAGAVHTDCLIELAVHSTEHRHDVGPWERCETCDEPFTGATAMTLAKAWMDRTATMDPVAEERLIAQANLARLNSDEGKHAEAEALYLVASDGLKTVLGEWHTETTAAVIGLSIAYCDQAKYAEAEALQTRILDHLMESSGEDTLETASAMAALSDTYDELGKFDESEELREKILAIHKRELGNEHPDTLTAMTNLGVSYSNQRKLAEALSIDLSTYYTSIRVFGALHVDTLNYGANLVGSYLDMERFPDAEKLVHVIVDGFNQVNPPDHPDTIFAQNMQVRVLMGKAEYTEAEELMRSLCEKSRRIYTEEHPEYWADFRQLADCLYDQEKYAEAENCARTALEGLERVFGENHSNTVTSRVTLSKCALAQGRLDEAAEVIAPCVAEVEADNINVNTHQLNVLVGEIESRRGNHAEAIALLEAATAALRTQPEVLVALAAQSNLAAAWARSGLVDKGVTALKQTYAAQCARIPKAHCHVTSTIERLREFGVDPDSLSELEPEESPESRSGETKKVVDGTTILAPENAT